MVGRRRRGAVPSITSARRALGEDQRGRTRRYLVAMAIRTVCLVLAVITPSPWWWGFVAGAVVLPYIAVVLANAGRERATTPETYVDPTAAARPQLPPAPAPQLYDPRTEYLR